MPMEEPRKNMLNLQINNFLTWLIDYKQNLKNGTMKELNKVVIYKGELYCPNLAICYILFCINDFSFQLHFGKVEKKWFFNGQCHEWTRHETTENVKGVK